MNANFTGNPCISGAGPSCGINPIAYTLFNYKFANGQYLIPSANPNSVIAVVRPCGRSNPAIQSALIEAFPEDAEVPGTALFRAHQAVADLDWNPNSSHSFSVKYYYQHDPTIAPFGYSMVAGFAQHLDAGSQVISLSHTQIVKSNLSVTETFGFIREKAYSTIDQPFTTAQFASACETLTQQSAADCTINTLGTPFFPGMSMVFAGSAATSYAYSSNIGAGASSMGAFTGVFQNRFNPSANAIWSLGKHTITFGGIYGYTQLNTRDERNQIGTIAAPDFTSFVTGNLSPDYSYNITALLVGNPNRYWRANDSGEYVQDKFQMRSNLSITAGLRWDWNGGLTEKYGNLLNFDPSRYNYNPLTDTIVSNGLIVAGNNAKAATPGANNTTLYRAPVGICPPLRRCLEPQDIQRQTSGPRGLGNVLRSRRTFCLPLTGHDAEHHNRRAVRDQPVPTLRQYTFRWHSYIRAAVGDCGQPCGESANRESREHNSAECLRACYRCEPSSSQCRMLGKYKQSYAFLSGHLCTGQQTPLYNEHHAGHSVAAFPRFGDRYRLRERPRPS